MSIVKAIIGDTAYARRSKWDLRYLNLSREVSTWSQDPSTQTGAVIVRPDWSVASVGFNGFPKGMPDSPELYANRDEKYSRIVHCEMNAREHAPEKVTGYTLYTYPFASCDRCAVHMIQAGITRFVFPMLPEHLVERWAAPLEKTLKYFYECGKSFTEYDLETGKVSHEHIGE